MTKVITFVSSGHLNFRSTCLGYYFLPSYKYHRSISQFFILEKMLLSLVFLVVGAAVAFGGEEVHVVNVFQKSVF